jgi:hypothetical protein
MALDEVSAQPWARKHDDPAVSVVPSAPRTAYPKSLAELIEICAKRAPHERIHAAGSHWALSEAAISDAVFVETHDPNNNHQAMGKTLYEVVPRCLSPQFIGVLASRTVLPFDGKVAENEGLYPIHVETGKRVYQLYAELDAGDDAKESLATLLETKHGNSSYRGPWAPRTLGNSGGQTVFGALTTGTHGGDFRIPPIADSVMALHLVADGGKHYWIEPEAQTLAGVQMTADGPLHELYGQKDFGGPDNFAVLRNDDIFDSVLVAAGRFGIVYSMVIAAVRQYSLHQERRLTVWQDIKTQVNDPTSPLYSNAPPAGAPAPASDSRFLQVAVSVTPHENFSKNLAGVTKRWNVPLAAIPGTTVPAGRPERVGPLVNPFDPFDSAIQAPRFLFAGNSHTYTPDPNNPGLALDPGFLARACTNAKFMDGVIQSVITEVENFVNSKGAVVGAALLAVTAVGGGALVLSLLAALLVILPILIAILALLQSQAQPRFGQTMNDVRDALLNHTDPEVRAAGTLVWHMIAYQVFSSEQANADYEAISYAVMEGHDYLDKSCNLNIDSIEVFFNAEDPMLIAFVDALLAFETAQEVGEGKAMVGFISLRFTGPTRAMIGQQRWPITCAIEVAGMRDVMGSKGLLDFATAVALDNNFKGILHWGQRNGSTRAHIQERFGDTTTDPTGRLRTWRNALSGITDNGRLDGFSNAFTRQTGLEIVTPAIGNLDGAGGLFLQPITITWDCTRNPPSTTVSLDVVSPSGAQTSFAPLPLVGQEQLLATEHGVYTARLIAAIGLGGERRETSDQVTVSVG